jgi:hypothetical protein
MANGDKVESLETILNNLQTDEGKAKAIAMAVAKGYTKDPKYTEQTFNDTDLNATVEYIAAAEKAYVAGNFDEAILNYEKAGCFEPAAELAFKMGYAERGRAYKRLQKIQEMENDKNN